MTIQTRIRPSAPLAPAVASTLLVFSAAANAAPPELPGANGKAGGVPAGNVTLPAQANANAGAASSNSAVSLAAGDNPPVTTLASNVILPARANAGAAAGIVTPPASDSSEQGVAPSTRRSSAAGNALGKNSKDILKTRGPAQNSSLPRHARLDSGVTGEFDTTSFDVPSLRLTLADGRTIEAKLQRVANNGRAGRESWIGTFDDSPGSSLVLSRSNGAVTGFGNYKDLTFEIVPTQGGQHLLYEVDGSRLPSGDRVETTTGGGAELDTESTSGSIGGAAEAGLSVVQDVLMVYTAAAAGAWGQATLETMIQSAIESANQAYQNSNANITVKVVGLQQVAMSESGSGMQATLSALKSNTEVRSLQDKLAADMVVLVSQDSDWRGYASLS